MKLHKFNGKVNVISKIISTKRKALGLSYSNLSDKLQLIGVCLYKNDLFLIENDRRLVRDFELIALFQVLKIDYSNINKLLDKF